MKGHVHGIPLTRNCQGQPRSRNQSNKPHASYELKEKDTERFENYSSDNSCIIFTKFTYDIKISRHAINLGRKVIYAPSEDRSALAGLGPLAMHKAQIRSKELDPTVLQHKSALVKYLRCPLREFNNTHYTAMHRRTR